MLRLLPRVLCVVLALALSLSPLIGITEAQAAVSNWQKGITVVSESTTDFSSSSFQQSMRNAKATGANAVALIVPYYQSNDYTTDIAAGWNTPTDASLISAIDFLHSIGMSVAIKVHLESYDGSWRAYINPSDRS